VFVSYTNLDDSGKGFASELWKVLRSQSYDVFFFDHSSKEHLGQNVWTVIGREISRRDILVVICSKAISLSEGAELEFNLAMLRGKLVVPLKHNDAKLPDVLEVKIYARFDSQNSVDVFQSLAEALPAVHHRFLSLREERQRAIAKLPKKVPLKIVPPSRNAAMLLQSIVRAYHEDSILNQLCTVENYVESLHSNLIFFQIGKRVSIPKEWMELTDRVLLVDDLGATVALGERNYLNDFWSKQIRTEVFPAARFALNDFQQILQELASNMKPTALLSPIERYEEMASWNRNGLSQSGGIRWEYRSTKFVMKDGRELSIFWSNKFAPLDKFVLIDQSATRWVVKPDPDSGDRLTAFFVQNEKDPQNKVDFYIKTVGTARLVASERVKLFRFD
jgi:hypothetical protein